MGSRASVQEPEYKHVFVYVSTNRKAELLDIQASQTCVGEREGRRMQFQTHSASHVHTNAETCITNNAANGRQTMELFSLCVFCS